MEKTNQDKEALLKEFLSKNLGISGDIYQQKIVSKREISRTLIRTYKSGSQKIKQWRIYYQIIKQKRIKKNILNKFQTWLQNRIVEAARSQIGSTQYSKWGFQGNFIFSESKCNLFVADCLIKAGVSLQLQEIYTPGRLILLNLLTDQQKYVYKMLRPPTAAMWANVDYHPEKYEVVGVGKKGLRKCQPGDIISDGNHCGIISGNGKVISASSLENKIVQNDWGFREDQITKIVIRRCKPLKK